MHILVLVHDGHANARRFFTQENASSYDSIVRFTTFGRDHFWKRQILQSIANNRNNCVLELACGTGILSSMLMKIGKNITGLDLTYEYLSAAKRKFGLALAQGTAEIIPYRNESFDAIVSSYLAKYVNIQKVVEECWRVLRPRGLVIFHDFTHPKNGAVRTLWDSYFSILRLAGVFIKSWRVVFEQLDDVIRKSDWLNQTQEALCNTGFQKISCRYYTQGTAAIITAEKP